MYADREVEISRILPNITGWLNELEEEQQQKSINEYSRFFPRSESHYSTSLPNPDKFFPDKPSPRYSLFGVNPFHCIFDFRIEKIERELHWQLYGPMGEERLSPSEFKRFLQEHPYLDDIAFYGLLKSYIEPDFELC